MSMASSTLCARAPGSTRRYAAASVASSASVRSSGGHARNRRTEVGDQAVEQLVGACRVECDRRCAISSSRSNTRFGSSCVSSDAAAARSKSRSSSAHSSSARCAAPCVASSRSRVPANAPNSKPAIEKNHHPRSSSAPPESKPAVAGGDVEGPRRTGHEARRRRCRRLRPSTTAVNARWRQPYQPAQLGDDRADDRARPEGRQFDAEPWQVGDHEPAGALRIAGRPDADRLDGREQGGERGDGWPPPAQRPRLLARRRDGRRRASQVARARAQRLGIRVHRSTPAPSVRRRSRHCRLLGGARPNGSRRARVPTSAGTDAHSSR